MRSSDIICPQCKAGYRRIEVNSGRRTTGEYRCLLCDHVLEIASNRMPGDLHSCAGLKVGGACCGYIHRLNCAHGIALAQLARKFAVPDPKLGDTFLVGWDVKNAAGHEFARNAELRGTTTGGHDTVDDWVRAECLLASDNRKIKADLVERTKWMRLANQMPSSNSLIPSLRPPTGVEMLILLRCMQMRPHAMTRTLRSWSG